MVNTDTRLVSSSSALSARAVETAIVLPAHLVQAKGHGHAGTAMGMAGIASVLYGEVMRHDPSDPAWEGRDRFVLSAGHASLLVYIQLHLTGYGLTLDDLARSRTLDSLTPGHPELRHTPGVEMSTGPLGQGVASAVGLALAARRDEALHGESTGLFDPTIWVLAGDGCLEEGVSAEASSLAGTLGTDNLVLIWDDNRVTIDGMTSESFSEDVRARYRAYGWRVLEITDALDLDAVGATLTEARKRTGQPTLVAVTSVIGFPSPAAAGTPAAHSGGFGANDVATIKTMLGFAADAPLEDLVPGEVLDHTREAVARGTAAHAAWDARHADWAIAHPRLAARRDVLRAGGELGELDAVLDGLLDVIADPDASIATRVTNGTVIQGLQASGILWGGSADLAGSTSVAVPGTAVALGHPGGDFIRFGIREHAMAAILSGIALHGLWRPFGSTYLVFSDYQRPSIRLAALMKLPVLYVYTHDSVAVGEDGPTHQPVEQIASLRTVPGLDVVRPADAHETIAVWRRLLRERDRPAALVLSRQGVPLQAPVDPELVSRGGYIAWRGGAPSAVEDEVALIATGSELQLALDAARRLAADGRSVRVVSMPCVEWFAESAADWREHVLPVALRRRVAIEAGRSDGWWRWVGVDGAVVGVETFGESGSGAEVLARHGITTDRVLAAVRAL